MQNLSWKASLKTAFEGVQIKQFGLGLNSRSNADQQAFLTELMASRSPPSTPARTATRNAAAAQPGAQEAPSSPLQAAAAPHSTHEAIRTPKPLSSRLRAARSQIRSTPADITPPAAFDARDIYEGQAPCKAFQVLDQGGCGACYAFSSAVSFSARLCSTDPSSSVRNVVISPQSLLDCAQGGCTGGDVLSTLASLVDKPAVELWCDPYTGAQKACGSKCDTSNTYGAEPGSVRQVGGAGEAGVVQMQLELVRGGPGVVGLTVMSDLFSYSSGVYSPSASATLVGRHAVSLVGWGEDNGVAYWICQNSWGADWGERGFFRIARGADTCGIESNKGLAVVKPLIEPLCPAADCAYASTTLRDCSCQCPAGLSGPQCQDCSLSCGGGGAAVDSCTRCECPMGVWGGDPECNSGFQLSSLASCGQDPSRITVQYSFSGAGRPPTQTSFVGVFPPDETGPLSSVASSPVCGSTYPNYDPATNGGLCPSQGSFELSRPTAPGQYKIVVVPFSPRDSNGLSGYYPLEDADTIGLYTVLPDGCSDASRADAQHANDPAALLAQRLAASAPDVAAMKARLDAAQPIREALLAEGQPTLTIDGLSASAPAVVMGEQGTICYSIPPSGNVNPKGLVLFVGAGAGGSYYPDALGAGDAPLPEGPQGCTAFTVSTGVAPGPYTIALEDSTTGTTIAVVSFTAAAPP